MSFIKGLVSIGVLVVVSGCVNSSGARMGLFSATAPVYAILSDDFFIGEAIGYMDRTGTIEITSVIDESVKCIGEFRYTGSKTGVGSVNCNDGTAADLQFNSLSMISGYGYGQSTRGPASFTYGLTPEQSEEYLRLPKGHSLVEKPDKSVAMIEI